MKKSIKPAFGVLKLKSDDFVDKIVRDLNVLTQGYIDFDELVGDILRGVINSNNFIDCIVLSDESGLVLSYSAKNVINGFKYIDEVLGPASAIIVATARKISETSNLVRLNAVLIEGEEGGLIASPLTQKFILAIQYKKNAPKGLIARDFNFLRRRLIEVIKHHGWA